MQSSTFTFTRIAVRLDLAVDFTFVVLLLFVVSFLDLDGGVAALLGVVGRRGRHVIRLAGRLAGVDDADEGRKLVGDVAGTLEEPGGGDGVLCPGPERHHLGEALDLHWVLLGKESFIDTIHDQ